MDVYFELMQHCVQGPEFAHDEVEHCSGHLGAGGGKQSVLQRSERQCVSLHAVVQWSKKGAVSTQQHQLLSGKSFYVIVCLA